MLNVYLPDNIIEVTSLVPRPGERFESAATAGAVAREVLDLMLLEEGEWLELGKFALLQSTEVPSMNDNRLAELPPGVNFVNGVSGGYLGYSLPQSDEPDMMRKISLWEYDLNTILVTQPDRTDPSRTYATAAATVIPLEELLDKKLVIQFAGF